MSPLFFRRYLLLSAATLAFGAGAVPAQDRARPNVIVILADDLGYGSLACYGAKGVKTPHLDRLAKEGRRFTQAYAPGSVCSPTRYGLVTGRYYWRTSVKDGEVLPGNAPLHIETGRLTLASLCKGRGYRTAAAGKWHLGLGAQKTTDWSGELKPGPREVGFDDFFGLAANPWNGPHSFIEDRAVTGRVPGQPVIVTAGKEDGKTSGIERPWQENAIMRTLTDRAVAWVEQNARGPFFLYFAPNAVHRPVVPHPDFKGSPVGVYGDFIEELDASVGRLLGALDRLKLAADTLVIFTSDNGGVINATLPEVDAALRAGLRINGLLRGGKHDVYEGGFREPFLVRWPGRVPAGTVSDDVVCATDVLATLAGILGVELRPGQAEDSVDVRGAFFGTGPGRDHVILQDAHGVYAIRMGSWKLIERVNPPAFEPRNKAVEKKLAAARKKAPGHDELYDLATDPAEARDVHAAHPEVVARLRLALAEARRRGQTR